MLTKPYRPQRTIRATALIIGLICFASTAFAGGGNGRYGVFRDRKAHATYQKKTKRHVQYAEARIGVLTPSKEFVRDLKSFNARAQRFAASANPSQNSRETHSIIAIGQSIQGRTRQAASLTVRKKVTKTKWDVMLTNILDTEAHEDHWATRAIKKMPNGNVVELLMTRNDVRDIEGGHFSIRDASGKTLVKRGNLDKLQRALLPVTSTRQSEKVDKRTENRVRKLFGVSPKTLDTLLDSAFSD